MPSHLLIFLPLAFAVAVCPPAAAFVVRTTHQTKTYFPAPCTTRADRKNYLASSITTSTTSTTLHFDQHQHQMASNSTTELSISFSDIAAGSLMNNDFYSHNTNNFKIFCDMDGVLVDFEKGVRKLLNRGTSSLDKGTMWRNIAQTPHWFEKLEWKQDGKRLWNAIKPLRPDILTGVPDIESSCVDKYNWCKRELELIEAQHVDMAFDGPNCGHESINGNLPRDDTTNVITCWSNNKYRECKSGSVLIDDRIDLRDSWEAAGGIFIHHVDAETTILKLREHGILPEQLESEEWYWEGDWRLWRP